MSCRITRNRAKRELKFEQHVYTPKITERFRIDNTAMVLAAVNVKSLSKEYHPKTSEDKEVMTKIYY